MSLAPGTRLGRYEIRTLLGAGGMGEVYRAHDRDLERDVAIKVLRDPEDSGDRLRRFVQEARAASGLHHPNVAHVYEIGSQESLRFIAMELVEGETLRDRIGRGAMSVDEVLNFGTQIAAAIGAAHKMGIVHRDIKPENVIITADGYAKVLDFGLAKLREMRGDEAATLLKTNRGVAMGTIAYMAPEQLLGTDVTPSADVFSLGVVLYEMLAGRRPFGGDTTSDIASAILTKPPQPLPDVPRELASVIGKALSKNVDERYRDATELAEQLRNVETGFSPSQSRAKARLHIGWVAAIIAIALIAAGIWKWNDSQRRRQALDLVAKAERFLNDRRLADAFDAASAAALALPTDDHVRDIISRTSGPLRIESDPEGAIVYLQRFKGPQTAVRMGVTPLDISRLARADYLLTLDKPGYAKTVRTISTMPLYLRDEAVPTYAQSKIHMTLVENSKAPAGMVIVDGGIYRLAGFSRPSERAVQLSDFFIDRCEVSNRDFEQFVRAGGYRNRALWKHPFVDNVKTLSFEQAMARFHDVTGLPGPRSWSGGAPPSGKENHPVTDITWYEAAAFAEWKGKQLPSIYQWEKAARYPGPSIANSYPWGFTDSGVDVNERANFRGDGTMPVDSLPFGASPYGALHMAGNVSEWCRNAIVPGFAARGGAYKDAMYAFGQIAAFPGFYSSPTLGFRCVTGGSGDEGDFAINPAAAVPVYRSVYPETYELYARRYDYNKAEPLNARVVQHAETTDWIQEKITFQSAGKTIPAYLYLPKGVRPPYQVIQYAPAGDVTRGIRTLPHSIEKTLGPLIRSGRGVFSVELEGFLGRPHPADWVAPDREQDEWVEENVRIVTEMRRGLDYLESRPDVDHSRIALYGMSAGGGPGVFVAALDSRYRSIAFCGTGIPRNEQRYAPAGSRINFVPHIKGPTFMLQGRYDEDTSITMESEPMFRLLSEPKRFQVFDGPHVPPFEVFVPAITKWFDETMGPVAQ